jgi:hypothetical protein
MRAFWRHIRFWHKATSFGQRAVSAYRNKSDMAWSSCQMRV